MKPKLIITGATGNTGQVLAELLYQNGIPFAAMARGAKRIQQLQTAGIQTVAGDFDDPASLAQALEGVEQAYLVCTPDENLVKREVAFIQAAKKAGVKQIVKCSAFAADINSESQNLRSHGQIEKALIESGLNYTILRPHGFMQTFTLFAWDMIERAHVISMPAGDGAFPLVDVRDVALAAFKALTEPEKHSRKIYDITGPESLSNYDLAKILAGVLGHPVTYLPGDERQLKMVMSLLGVPPVPTQHTLVIFRWQREHKAGEVLPTLEQIGITPIRYEQFVRDLVAGYTGGGNSFQPPDTLLVRLMNATMPLMMKTQLLFQR